MSHKPCNTVPPKSFAASVVIEMQPIASMIASCIGRIEGMSVLSSDASWGRIGGVVGMGVSIVHRGGVVEFAFTHTPKSHKAYELATLVTGITVASMCGASHIVASCDSKCAVSIWNGGGMPRSCPRVDVSWKSRDCTGRAHQLAYTAFKTGQSLVKFIPLARRTETIQPLLP